MEARDFERVWVDGDLRVRAGRRAAATWTALYRHAPGKGWSRIVSYDAETARLAGVVGLSADGRELFVVDAVDRDKAALKAYDLAAGRWRVLADDPLADLLPQGALLHPRTGGVQAVVSYFGRLRRHTLDPDVALDFEFLGSARPGDLSFVGRSLDDRVWLVRYLDGAPAVYYAWERAARRLTRLFSEAPALDGAPFAARRAVVIAARDGLALPCDLYLPPGSDRDGDGRPEEPLPLLVYVHGGPWLGFERNLWPANRHFQLLANRGYAVVRAEFRGAAGYGRAFMDRGDREWGGRMHDDLADIAAWAVAEGIAERGRIGVWGWSYGGYATLAALAFSPDLFACGVSLYGLADLEDFVGRVVAAGWGDTWTRRVGDPATPEGRLLLREHSPLRAAHRVRGPLLVSHGALDRITPPDQSAAMVEALRRLGRPVTHLVHPDEGHDYRRPETWRSFWAIAERFLQAHLGGRREPDGIDLDGAAVRIAAGEELIPGLDLDLIDNAAARRPASSAGGKGAKAARPAAPPGRLMSQPGITEDPHAHPDPVHVDPADPGGGRRRE